jgi:hypothetical protein
MAPTPRRPPAPAAALLALLLAPLAGCAHKREAYYPPADPGAGGSSKIAWPWSKEARKPVEPPLAESTRAQARTDPRPTSAPADDEDRFDFDQVPRSR